MKRPVSLAVALATAGFSSGAAEEVETCGLYLAQTLDDRGRLTMGVFAGSDISPGTVVTRNDVVVPLVDIPTHNSPDHGAEEGWWGMWSSFVWDPVDVGGVHEGIDVNSAGLGMGSLVRGNPDFANVMLTQSDHDNSGVHRSRDSSAGAFSYYPGSELIATDMISAGQELYFQNGFSWFLDPDADSRYPVDTLSVNHGRVKDFYKLYQELEAKYGPEVTAEFRSNLWNVVQLSPMDESLRDLLPSSWADTTDTKTQATRSPKWLKENGICIDNIRQGPSTIPRAGKGAFATRNLASGSIVAPAPLVHVPDKSSLDMFDIHIADDGSAAIDNVVVSKQLLLNYCFGHKTTAMLLCPIGPGTSFINHSPKPNAAIRWSTHKSSSQHNEEWLTMTDLELGDALDIGLTLEYVALQDIKEGDEIFIDYGIAWQAAWEEHILTWNPIPTSAKYLSAADMNMKELQLIRTIDEQKSEPYPISVVTSCVYEYIPEEATNMDMANHAIVKSWEPLHWGVPEYMYLRPCRIMSRDSYAVEGEAAKHTYTAQIQNYPNMHESQIVPSDTTLIVTGVPRDAISFTDFTYTTDTHLRNAFRHEMIMDDAVFPQKWRYL